MSLDSTNSSTALDNQSFQAIAQLAYKESGLILEEEKSAMIQSRLRHRLRALGITEFAEYCTYVNSQDGKQERRQLISALTTNVSHFFREDHHFDKLRDVLASRASAVQSGAPMRIWSAGCSNGQEPLSIAMTAREHFPKMAERDFRILATDIDPEVLKFAQQGVYPERLIGGAPQNLRSTFFDHQDGVESSFSAKPILRDLIRYNELNLLGTWPMKSKFDVIFCRNVVIYFDAETQNKLWPRFHKALRNDGLLFLGHSERIAEPERFGFECIGPTTYRPLSV